MWPLEPTARCQRVCAGGGRYICVDRSVTALAINPRKPRAVATVSRTPPRRRAKKPRHGSVLPTGAESQYRRFHQHSPPSRAPRRLRRQLRSRLQRLRRKPRAYSPAVTPLALAAAYITPHYAQALASGRLAPCAAPVRSLRSPHNWRYANLAPATVAPACAGALNPISVYRRPL